MPLTKLKLLNACLSRQRLVPTSCFTANDSHRLLLSAWLGRDRCLRVQDRPFVSIRVRAPRLSVAHLVAPRQMTPNQPSQSSTARQTPHERR